MQLRMRLSSLAFILVLCLCLFGCNSSNSIMEDGKQAYSTAVSILDGKDFSVTATIEQTTTNGSIVLHQEEVQNITYDGYMSNHMRVAAQKEIKNAEQITTVREYAEKDTVYLNVNEESFAADITHEQLLSRYYPCGLLNAELYETVLVQKIDGQYQIDLTAPRSAETWAIPDDAQLIDASGNAVLLKDGTLTQSTYNLAYQHGPAVVNYSVTCVLNYEGKLDNQSKKDFDSHTIISDIDAPILLELACAKLLSVSSVDAQSTYETVCEAGGLQRSQTVNTAITQYNAQFSAQVDTQVTLTNHSQQGAVSTFVQSEAYRDGKYSISPSNGTQTVTQAQMKSYCNNNLVSSLLLPGHIISTQLSEDSDRKILSFGGTSELAQLLLTNAYQSLYADSTVPEDLFKTYTTQAVNAQVEICRHTGLPLTSGLYYSGSSQIDESNYAFTVSIQQVYNYEQ